MRLRLVGLACALTLLLGPATPTGGFATPPNIVFIMTDDQALSDLAQMPYTNGRSDWLRFSNAFVNHALCCPSRASILRGQYSHHTGVDTNGNGKNLNESASYPVWLTNAGYENALYGKYLNNYPFAGEPKVPPGWSSWAAIAGPPSAYNYTLHEPPNDVAYGSAPEDYLTDVLREKALDFLAVAQQPFFLSLHPHAPHYPSTPAPRHDGLYDGFPITHGPNFNEADVSDKPAWVRALAKKNVAEMDARRRNAYESLRAVDEAVQAVFDALTERGILDQTIVIFTSDNGRVLGEHRFNGKQCPYEECIRVPLLIRVPGIPGRTIPQFTSNVDFAPTFAAWAGTSAPGVDGASLVPLINGNTAGWRDRVLIRNKKINGSSVPSFWGIRRNDQYVYVEYDSGERELYDLATDPYELQNVASSPAYALIRAELASQLSTLKQ